MPTHPPNSTNVHPAELRATFVMEQQLGHATFYKNLRDSLDDKPQLDINWVEAWYDPTDTMWEKIPGIPHRTRNILGAHSRVWAGLKAESWDVAFFNTHVPARMAGWLRNRGPYVVTSDITPLLHDTMSEPYGRPVETNPVSQWYKHWLHTTMFQNAARLLPWSNWVRDSLIADYGVATAKIEVIPPGVDLDQWQPAQIRRTNIRQDDDPTRLLFVSGDFSDDRTKPEQFALSAGDNLISASSSQGDAEYYAISIPAGMALDEIVLTSYESATDVSFIGIQSGPTFTEPPTDTVRANLLGYALFGSDPISVTTNILDDMGAVDDAIGFSGPLPSGTYTIWSQETSPDESRYSLNFVVKGATKTYVPTVINQ